MIAVPDGTGLLTVDSALQLASLQNRKIKSDVFRVFYCSFVAYDAVQSYTWIAPFIM
jgi:hypothetical protein